MSQIKVPPLGESVSEATVAKWYKKEGEAVAKDELLVELETDKVTLEVNAPADGALENIAKQEGETVEVDTLLGTLKEGAAGTAPAQEAPATQESAPAAAPAAPAPTAQSASKGAAKGAEGAGPAARKLLEETGINPEGMAGSGKDGRITKGDVLAAATSGTPAGAASSSDAPARGEERVRMTKLRQTIARRLKESQNTAAMLTTFNEIDMSKVMALRSAYKEEFQKVHGAKLGFMSFFVKAAVQALKELPAVNAEIDGQDIVYKHYQDIGVAVGTEQGLVVPVVRDCASRSFANIEQTIVDLATKAREGKLGMQELTGGTFTITNGGVYGSMLSTPIINPPQSAILGLHNITKRPVVLEDGSIVARPMMYVALSYDHRIIDGREAVTFLVRIKQAMEDPQRLLLEV